MDSLKKYGAIFVILVIAGLLITRIIYVRKSREQIAGEPPVKQLEFYKHWITVYPLAHTKLADFVDLRLFNGFKPGITFDEAVVKFGKPDNIRKEEFNTYYEYWTDISRIEIGREEYAIPDKDVGVAWPLYVYPKDLSFYDILHPAISKHINPEAEKTVVQIKDLTNELSLVIIIEGQRVDHLIWIR